MTILTVPCLGRVGPHHAFFFNRARWSWLSRPQHPCESITPTPYRHFGASWCKKLKDRSSQPSVHIRRKFLLSTHWVALSFIFSSYTIILKDYWQFTYFWSQKNFICCSKMRLKRTGVTQRWEQVAKVSKHNSNVLEKRNLQVFIHVEIWWIIRSPEVAKGYGFQNCLYSYLYILLKIRCGWFFTWHAMLY